MRVLEDTYKTNKIAIERCKIMLDINKNKIIYIYNISTIAKTTLFIWNN